MEYLQQFDIGLVQRSGSSKELSVADYLSRVTNTGVVKGVAVVKISEEGQPPVNHFLDVRKIKAAQENDEDISRWKERLRSPETRESPDKAKEQFTDRMVMDSNGNVNVKCESSP